jgi:hypothetical protein
MWVYVAIIGLCLGAGYWVGYPLLKPRKFDSPIEPNSEDSLANVKIEKEEIYSAIKEMELDHKMGKLSQEDYLNLREKYRDKAIGSLKRMDELERKGEVPKDIEDEIEREVSTLRMGGKTGKPRKAAAVYCTQCGKKGSPEGRFCSWCGARLTKP